MAQSKYSAFNIDVTFLPLKLVDVTKGGMLQLHLSGQDALDSTP